jgi:hypothetical protein
MVAGWNKLDSRKVAVCSTRAVTRCCLCVARLVIFELFDLWQQWSHMLPSVINALGPEVHLKEYLTTQVMYVRRNIQARSRNRCCRGQAVLHILSVCL